MSLKEWFGKGSKGDWVDIGAPKKGGGFKKCGRTKLKSDRKRKYPKCCLPSRKFASLAGDEKASTKPNMDGKITMIFQLGILLHVRSSTSSFGTSTLVTSLLIVCRKNFLQCLGANMSTCSSVRRWTACRVGKRSRLKVLKFYRRFFQIGQIPIKKGC